MATERAPARAGKQKTITIRIPSEDYEAIVKLGSRIVGNPTPSQIAAWATRKWVEQQAAKVPGSQGGNNL